MIFTISEDDLATLESELPRLLETTCTSCNDAVTRKRWEAVKKIIADVRWQYGPPTNVETLGED